MKHKFTIIGTGTFATALGKILIDSGHENVVLYGIDNTEVVDLRKGKNLKYYPDDIVLPNFTATTNLAQALSKCDYLILAVPSKVIGPVFQQILSLLSHPVLVINATKGTIPYSVNSLHTDLENLAQSNEYIRGIISLLGPGHAEEIVLEKYTTVAIIGHDINLIKEGQKIFNNHYFRTYLQEDLVGAQVGAVYKNVLAIASGICAGKKYGINTTAALLTRGVAEMQKFNQALGGKTPTIYGLTGVGDLIVTALSPLSRNYQFGFLLATEGTKKALATKKTVEGLSGLNYIKKIADQKKLDLPIVQALFKIVYEQQKIEDIVRKLWERELKAE